MKAITHSKRFTRSRAGNFIYFLLILAAGLFTILPMLYSILTSLKPLDELMIFPPRFYPRRPSFNNFIGLPALLSNLTVPLSRYVFNSFFVTIVTTMGHIFVASMASYVLSKTKFKARYVINLIVQFALLYSAYTLAVPQYVIFAKLGMIDTYWVYILPYLPSTLIIPKEPDDTIGNTTATVISYITNKVSPSTPDKNLVVGNLQSSFKFNAETSYAKSIIVPVEKNKTYMFSAWIKGNVLSDENSGNIQFGIANPRKNKFLSFPVEDGEFAIGQYLVTPSWDNQWHQRGMVFNSGDLDSVEILLISTASQGELRDFVICELEDAVVPVVKVPKKIEKISKTTIENMGCREKDNLFKNPKMSPKGDTYWSKGLGYGNRFKLANVDGNGVLRLDGTNSGIYYVKWVDVKPNTSYTFTLEVYTQEGSTYAFGLWDSNTVCSQVIGTELTFDGNNAWQLASFRFNSGGNTRVALYIRDDGGRAYFDNAKLFESSKAISLTDSNVTNPKTGEDLKSVLLCFVVLLAAAALALAAHRKTHKYYCS